MARFFVCAALTLFVGHALAQPVPCGRHDEIVKMLSLKYNEIQRAVAITNNFALMEIFTSVKGTWTMLVTTPDGKTCIADAGNSWEDISPGEAL